MYTSIYIKEKEFDGRRAEAKKCTEENFGDDESGKNLLTFDDLNTKVEELYLDDGEINLTLNTEIGDIYMAIPLSKDLEIAVLQHAIKKYNKAKQFLENMKD